MNTISNGAVGLNNLNHVEDFSGDVRDIEFSSDEGAYKAPCDGVDPETPVQASIFTDLIFGKLLEFAIEKGFEVAKDGLQAAKGALKAAGEVAVKVAENAGRGAGAPPGVAAPPSK